MRAAPVSPLPSPAWVFELLVAQDPQCRLTGWVKQMQGGLYGYPDASAVWEAHADALCALARAHGFEPAYLTHRTPTGAGFEAWRVAFLREHTY